jgi:hypothetical protein
VAAFDEFAWLRFVLQTGTPLVNEKFKAEIEAAMDLSVGFARRGNPQKKCSHELQIGD